MARRPARPRRSAEIDALMKTIGSRIAACRKHRGLAQAELAERIGVSQALLSAYELGKARIGADVILKISEALRVPTDEILGRKEPKESAPLPGRRLLRRLARFEGLPRRRQDALVQTLDAFLGDAGRA